MPARSIPALTGLRGIAAVWVVLYHLFGRSPFLINRGYMGVDVFFILSGFVLSYGYAERFQNPTIQNYFSFLKARVARIFPLHLTMLLVVAVCVITLPGFAAQYPMPHERFGISAFIASAFLIQNWFHWLPSCWDAPSWSLSAEWAAYLAFPVFVWFTQRWRSIRSALLFAVLSLVIFVCILTAKGVHDINFEGSLGMARATTEFCCGCLLFRAQSLGMRRLPQMIDVVPIALLIISCSVANATLLGPFAMAFIVLRAAQSTGPIANFLSLRLVVGLGEISYSIYLVHWIVIQVFSWAWPVPTIIRDVAIILLTLVISCFTYSTIELRARQWGKWRSTRPVVTVPSMS
jgi:peptidoglycan/LPS O-acetylase OafA/YrhL